LRCNAQLRTNSASGTAMSSMALCLQFISFLNLRPQSAAAKCNPSANTSRGQHTYLAPETRPPTPAAGAGRCLGIPPAAAWVWQVMCLASSYVGQVWQEGAPVGTFWLCCFLVSL
jgi:hypothetical protein